MLALLNGAVVAYLLLALYIICLYGSCLGPGPSHVRCGLAVFESDVYDLCSVCLTPAVKFSPALEVSWLASSLLGFAGDVLLSHTLSLFVRSVLKLVVRGHAR